MYTNETNQCIVITGNLQGGALASQPRNKRKERMPAAKPKDVLPPAHFRKTDRAWQPEEKAHWFNALCIVLANGGSLSQFCRDYPQGPVISTWFEWLQHDPIMSDRYAVARERCADTMAEDIVAIADAVKDAGQFDAARVNAARLRVDARKWVASKLKPKVYADRIETVQSGSLTVQHQITDDERVKALALMLGKQVIASSPNLIEAQRALGARDVTPSLPHEAETQETTAAQREVKPVR